MRQALALNPAVPPRVLLQLLQLDDAEVRLLVAGRADLQPEHTAVIIASADDDAAYALAQAGAAPVDLPALHAHRLQQHRLPTLRALAAASPHLTRAMQETLLLDPAPAVRRRLCDNHAIGPDLLGRLAADADDSVATAARQRLGTRRPHAAPPRAATATPDNDPAHRGP